MNIAYMRQVQRRVALQDKRDAAAKKARGEEKYRFTFHVDLAKDLPRGWKPNQSMVAMTEDEARLKLGTTINRQLNKDLGLRPEHRRPIQLTFLYKCREQ